MKHPEYDSPFELMMSDIATKIAKSTDEVCVKAVQKVGIDVDKEKLLSALGQDSERYREAYAKGYETGHEERNEETEKMLEKACQILNDMDSDFFCEALNNGDGWCEEHCIQNGYASCIECVKRWLKKQIEEE